MFWNTRREILLRSALMIGLFLVVFITAFIGWESNYIFDINDWKLAVLTKQAFIKKNILASAIGAGVGLFVVAWILISLIVCKKSRTIKIFCWTAIGYLLVLTVVVSGWFIYLLIDYETRSVVVILWVFFIVLICSLITALWFLKRQLRYQFQLRTIIERLQTQNKTQAAILKAIHTEITSDEADPVVFKTPTINWRRQIQLAIKWRQQRWWWISAISSMILIILTAASLSVIFLQIPAVKNNLNYPALPTAVQTVINEQYNQFAKNMEFRLPADQQKSAFIGRTTAVNLTEILDSKSTLTAVFNNQKIKDQLLKHNIKFLDIKYQKGFNNKQLYIDENGMESSLRLKPIMRASDYDDEAGQIYNNYGQIKLLPVTPVPVTPTYNLQLQFGIALVTYDPLSLAVYKPTKVNFKTTVTTTTPLGVITLINHLRNLDFLQPISIPQGDVSWKKALLNSLFSSFFEISSNHIFLRTGRPNFVSNRPIVLGVDYDNRYIKNLRQQLNKHIWTISNPANYKYTNEVLGRIISNYEPIQMLDDLSYNFPVDRYSGYVPGFTATDDEAGWGSQTTQFNGGFSVDFCGLSKITVDINYQQLHYANQKKRIQQIKLPLSQINNTLLDKVKVTRAAGSTTNVLQWNDPSVSFADFLINTFQARYNGWQTALDKQFRPYLPTQPTTPQFVAAWLYANLPSSIPKTAVTLNDIFSLVPIAGSTTTVMVRSLVSIGTRLSLSSSSSVTLTFPVQSQEDSRVKTITPS